MERIIGTIGSELKRIAAQTKVCLAKPGRFALDSLLLDCRSDGIFMVATNGTSMAVSKLTSYPDGQAGQRLVNAKALDTCLKRVKAKQPVLVNVHSNERISIQTEEFEELMPEVVGWFPGYRSIIPRPGVAVMFGYDELLALVQRGLDEAIIPDNEKGLAVGKFFFSKGVCRLDVQRLKDGPRWNELYISKLDVEFRGTGYGLYRSEWPIVEHEVCLNLIPLKKMLAALKGAANVEIELQSDPLLPITIMAMGQPTVYYLAPINPGKV